MSLLMQLLALFVPCGLALAQQTSPETSSWPAVARRSDPLRSEPPALNRSLRVLLPPDLLETIGPGELGDHMGDGDGLLPLELDCASRSNAGSPDNPQWALQTLRAGSTEAIPQLTLQVAMQLALCHNPQLRASWSQIAQQVAQLGHARSAYWPQLNAGIGRQRSQVDYSGADIPGTRTQATIQNVALSWRLWDFGARDARTEAAQAQVHAALSGQSATLQKVLGDVLYSYAEVQATDARMTTQKQLLPLAERNLLSAQRREAGGAGSAGDTLQAVTVQARIRLEQSRAEGELRKAHAQLGYLLGLPPGTAYTLVPMLPSVEQEAGTLSATTERLLAKALDDWLGQARTHHPAIEAARAQLSAAEASLEATESDGLPTVDLNLGHYRNGRPTQAPSEVRTRENVLSISVSIPLFDGYANTYKVRAAQASAEQKQVELQAIEQQTLLELVQQHAEAHATLNNLRAASDLHRAASAAVQSAQRQYEYGAFDIQQLNQSLTTLQQAQQDLVRSQLEWNRARLKLWLAEIVTLYTST